MSTVRMCDRCGNIFSEREEGWMSMNGTTMRRDKAGVMRQLQEQIDTCPRCTGGANIPTPQLAERAGVEDAPTP